MSKTRLFNLLKRRIGIRLLRPASVRKNFFNPASLWGTWGTRQFGKTQISQLARLGQPMVVMQAG